jgi:acyl-CoA synthetase (AMP-forming)/AMP-acid ligase II
MTVWLHDLADGAPDDALAIIDHDGARYTYGVFRGMVAQLADLLGQHGVRAGDRVMVVAENCASFAVAILALSGVGAWILPINARHTVDELRAIAAHSGARCLLFAPGASDPAMRHAVEFHAETILPLPCGDLAVTTISDQIQEPVARDPHDRIAAMLYTTGTTSAPKGVMLTHANLLWNARSSAKLRSLTAQDEVLAVLPLSHIFGFSSSFLAALYAGASVRFVPRFSPEAMLDAFAAGATALPAVPQMFERILTHLHQTGTALNAPRLRYISAGGAPLDPDLKARTEVVFGLTLNNGYGLTETSPGVSATRPESPREDVSIGPALDDVTLWIDQPNDEGVGELIIESPGVMKGYYHNDDATKAALIRPGVFRSGDLARIDPDGIAHLVGRVKELIIRSGFNVYPPEVEGMLTRHPDVLQAAVVPRNRDRNEDVLAFVMVQNGLDPATLATWLRPKLTAYKQPQHIFVVEAFPVAPTGKVLKHRLVSHFADMLAARDQETL